MVRAYNRLLGRVCCLVSVFLVMFLVALVSGVMLLERRDGSAASASEEVDIKIELPAVITISTDAVGGALMIPMSAYAGGFRGVADLNVFVYTNNVTGYALLMNSLTNDTSMVHVLDSAYFVNSTAYPYASPGTLAADSWGQSVWGSSQTTSSTTFSMIPPMSAPREINKTTAPSSNSKTTVSFGADASVGKPSGTYINTMVFTAITNYVPDPPLPVPPGIDPGIYSSTNPAIRDVYPTTGWGGEVVAITSGGLFTNVQSVTIGGTDCKKKNIISTFLILCELPVKTHGTRNDIVVMAGSPVVNVTDASVYTHMKVTYFNPTQTSVTIDGYTYPYYAATNSGNTFNSTICSTMTPSNSLSINPMAPPTLAGTGPNAATPSVVYARDARNSQVYKVKRMIDNKCWMIDNLKYIDPTIANSDSTTGTFFNGTGFRMNTVSGAVDTPPSSNWDKAFYNNPMGVGACYSGVDSTSVPIMASNTMTHCGYLYNWFGATAGTGLHDAIEIYGDSGEATGSICPENFRLPFSSLYNNTDHFAVLNGSMKAGVLVAGDRTSNGTTIPNWQPTSSPWFGTFSGNADYGGYIQSVGDTAYYWSSNPNIDGDMARYLFFNVSMLDTGNGSNPNSKTKGLAVRCVME